jgi:glycosyltransferase involved in cell wall biosynthesis
MKPFVSVVTPTYNRSTFVPALVSCYKAQTYPKDRMEWIILDDGPVSSREVFLKETEGLPNIRYIYEEEKSSVAAKRNRLNREAKGEILVAMDDDDYYPPTRIEHIVKKFQQQPKVQLAGASEVYMYHTDTKEIVKLGPYAPNHATNGTMAWRKSYSNTHFYDESALYSEEVTFLENYKNPLIQLDPLQTMLIMSHSENTFSKTDNFRGHSNNPFCKGTTKKLKDFIKDSKLRAFYESL